MGNKYKQIPQNQNRETKLHHKNELNDKLNNKKNNIR
jgi:hypothetical protein